MEFDVDEVKILFKNTYPYLGPHPFVVFFESEICAGGGILKIQPIIACPHKRGDLFYVSYGDRQFVALSLVRTT